MQALRLALVLVAGLSATGCGDALVYGERTGFNLSIEANIKDKAPLVVNAGFHRVAAGLAPATDEIADTGHGARAKGEAVSMLSGFGLTFNEGTPAPFDGVLTIKSQFASGLAASAIANNPAAAAVITDVPLVSVPSAFVQARFLKIDRYLEGKIEDDPDLVKTIASAFSLDATDAKMAHENINKFMHRNNYKNVETVGQEIFKNTGEAM